jgi:LysR family transcriptional regulator, transcriptional activator for dmlA
MAHFFIYFRLAMLDRVDLILVLAVNETGSLVGAARRMQVSGAAVTKRLAQIEARLSVRLFRRTTRSVVPTPEGELYCALARRVIEDFESLEARVADLGTTPLGSIKLACNVGFGRQWAAPVIEEFSRLYPSVEIELHLRNRLPDLQAEGFDGAIWLWHPLSTQWIIQTLARNSRVMVASPGYLQRAGTPRTPEDLSRHTCLLMLERDMPVNIWRLNRLDVQTSTPSSIDVRVSGPLRSNNGEVLRDWAIDGAGIALRPVWDVHAHIKSGSLVHVLPDYAKLDSDVQWIAPYRAHLPERVRLLKEFFEVRLRDAPWI